jgi:hypothetical protein
MSFQENGRARSCCQLVVTTGRPWCGASPAPGGRWRLCWPSRGWPVAVRSGKGRVIRPQPPYTSSVDTCRKRKAALPSAATPVGAPHRLKQVEGANDVGLTKSPAVDNNVAFSREVDHGTRLVLVSKRDTRSSPMSPLHEEVAALQAGPRSRLPAW